MSTKQHTAGLVAQIEAGITGLSELMADPGSVAFEEVADSFEELERVLNAKALIDAAADPITPTTTTHTPGRAGRAGPLKFNTTHAQGRSAGARLRGRRVHAPGGC
ncbi:hypothetical protein NYP18_04330 [Corynebacterium sp. YIM 101645]|uniref:Uncharacterized protein n=1 Tax=Corynebacterium lemuris TaxID=1859292 RepID=A0ABT2FVR5_9CORY|nr:hypothetical protein [Corynebacterium lemuris]MCS5478880.1 hypothetical protein [Corynebacterium lemuris]